MIIALLHPDEQLSVFEVFGSPPRVGPYQDLAPDLLELPEDEVFWLAFDPSGRRAVQVPAAFIAALIAGQAEEAARLLDEAVKKEQPKT